MIDRANASFSRIVVGPRNLSGPQQHHAQKNTILPARRPRRIVFAGFQIVVLGWFHKYSP